MKLSVIIVNYNVKYYLEQCLYSVTKATNAIKREIIVFDNHSSDGSVEYLKLRFPHVTFIAGNHNLGFAKANNAAIRQSAGEYVLLLNPDTFVGEEVLTKVIDFMDSHSDVGSCGVNMNSADGSFAKESRRGLPTVMTSFYKMVGLCQKYPNSRRFGKYYMSYLDATKQNEIEVVSGAFCMIRRKVLDKIGLLDTTYFMYGEDIDLSYRIRKAGYKNYYLPYKILHYKGESTHKTSYRYVHVFYKAMLIFFRKYYGHLSFFVTIPVQIAILFKAFLAYIYLQCGGMKKQLGLLNLVHEDTEYVFIGSQNMVDTCMKKAREKGLRAGYVVANDCTLPQGHHEASDMIDPSVRTYVVYDTGSYSYSHILDIMTTNPNPKIRLGTYSNKNDLIITEDEIFV